jgi:ADP-ribose pyrophosphatase YjhB (NUDIX family)
VDEDPVTGLKREVKEELAIEIDVSLRDLFHAVPHQYGDEGDWILSLGFVARFVSGEPVPGDDVASVKWITGNDVAALEWAWSHDKELARKVLADERSQS